MRFGRNIPQVWLPTLDFERYVPHATARTLVTYAYRYPEMGDRSVLRFGTDGREINGARPSEAIPLYADSLPARPLGQRWESKAIHALRNPLGNDQYGCCVFAAMFKQDIAWLRDAGDATSPEPTVADALGLYSRVTGFNPANLDTDQGGDLQTALAYAKAHGLYPDGRGKPAGWAAVDPSKPAMIRAAIDAFGSLYTGCQLAPEWIDNPQEGFVWDVTPSKGGADLGHCTAWFDYNAVGVTVNSWGLFGQITWAAIERYWGKAAGGEIYAVMSVDWMNKATKLSPSGFDIGQLAADLASL